MITFILYKDNKEFVTNNINMVVILQKLGWKHKLSELGELI